MPDEINNPSDVFGTTADLNAGSAVENVQAEEIRRLQAEKDQAKAFQPSSEWQVVPEGVAVPSGGEFRLDMDGGQNFGRWPQMKPLATADTRPAAPPTPLTAADMMQEAVREAEARTDAANARAAGFEAEAAIPNETPAPAPSPATPSRVWDADAANARAASRPVTEYAARQSYTMSSAPADAGSVFDAFAYDERIQAQNLAVRGFTSPDEWDAADDPRIAPSPSYARVGMGPDLWEDRGHGQVNDAMGSASPELRSQLDSIRAVRAAVSPSEDAPGSFRDRYASFKADWAEVGAAYRQSANEPFSEKFDNFADTAARFGVDTGVLGERVRGAGLKAVANMRQDFAEPYGKLNYGMAFAEIGREGGQYYEKTASGNYLTPEQQQSAAAGFLPGAGALAGTVIGSIIAPGAGSWVGGLVGGGAGTAAQGILTAGYEREQAVRQNGDIYSVQTGASTDALREFTDSLRQANVATKEAYAAFTTLASAGPGIGAGTLPGVALMSGALGERYNPALSGLSHALSADPVLRALQPALAATGGNLGAGPLGDISVAEAFSGNWEASNNAATLAEGALTNPQYAQDKSRQADLASASGLWRLQSPIATLLHPRQTGQEISAQWRLWTGQDDQYVPGADAQRVQIAKDRAGAYNLYTQGASAEEIAKTGISLAASRLGIAENQGATDAQLAATAQNLYGAVAAGVPKLTQQAAGIDAYMAAHPSLDPATRLKLQQTRDTALIQAEGMEGQQAQVQKVLFGRSLETEQSGFALAEMGDAYSGRSFASRAGIYRTQEDFLTSTADNPGPLSPAERNNLRQNALGMRRDFQQGELGEEEAGFGLSITQGTLAGRSAASLQAEYDRQAEYLNHFAQSPSSLLTATERTGLGQNAAQMHYEAGRSVFQESMGWAGVRDVQGQGQIAVAQTFGSPMDVYRADIGQVANQQAEVGIIDDRLRQNIPMSERIAITNQRQSIENDIAIAPERARVDAYNAQGSILADNQAVGRSLLDRSAQVLGAKAFTPDIFAADQASVSLFTGAEQGSPLGSLQRAVFGRERADAQAQMVHDRDTSYRFGDAAQRIGDMQAEGAFHRALEAPYRTGNSESDPLYRGMALEKTYQRDLVGVEAALARTPRDSPAYEYNSGLEQDYKNKIIGIEHDRMWEEDRRLPEMWAGGGGMVGNSVLAIPQAALSAFFHPNVRDGAWGHPFTMPGLSRPGSMPGDTYDAFQQYKAGTSSAVAPGYPAPTGRYTPAAGYPGNSPVPATGTAGIAEAIQTLAHNTNNQQLVGVLQQILTELRTQRTSYRGQPQGGPPLANSSSVRQSLSQGFNPNRPSR